MDLERSTILERHTLATEEIEKDLPIDPISHLVITLAGYNATNEATLAEMLGFLNSVKISKMGKTIYNMESEDIYAQNCYLFKRPPMLTGKLATDNYHRSLSLIIPLGRKLRDPSECYPATKKGELTLFVDTTIPATSWDNGIINIEAVTMPGASPKQHLKTTFRTISAPGGTGNYDIDIPIGNPIAAIGCRMTTFPTTSSLDFGINTISVKKNTKEHLFIGVDTMSLVADMADFIPAQCGTIAAQGLHVPDNTVFIDFDPDKDDRFLLQTKGLSSCVIDAEYAVDEAQVVFFLELEGH